jgi:hypothetical protein
MTFLENLLKALAIDSESGWELVRIDSKRNHAVYQVTLTAIFKRGRCDWEENGSFEVTMTEEAYQSRDEHLARTVAHHFEEFLATAAHRGDR